MPNQEISLLHVFPHIERVVSVFFRIWKEFRILSTEKSGYDSLHMQENLDQPNFVVCHILNCGYNIWMINPLFVTLFSNEYPYRSLFSLLMRIINYLRSVEQLLISLFFNTTEQNISHKSLCIFVWPIFRYLYFLLTYRYLLTLYPLAIISKFIAIISSGNLIYAQISLNH